MKKIYSLLLLIPLLILSCTSITYVSKNKLVKILPKDAAKWSLEECNSILDFYTADNSTNQIFKSSPINQKVYIKSLLLNKATIKAISRKEVIEKRLKDSDYYEILQSYLKDFSSLKYMKSNNQIEEADSSFVRGYSFKIYFENISNPYTPILLEDGYSYFFLENDKEEFSRVTEVTGLFVEDYFQLDGYLDAIITFSPFATNGNRLFESKDLNQSYKLVFNGLQKNPIEIKWELQ